MTTIQKLKDLGGSEWIKGDIHRIYFNEKDILKLGGASFKYYNSGNIQSGKLDNEVISNSYGNKLKSDAFSVKLWWDASDRKFHTKGNPETDIIERAIENIKKQM
ncbi:MAG: hypothetical protein Q4P17_03930 [Methanobacterium sp.]|nr:hypothetical protein [Methanobacterium sp.]